jgi:regulator of cell morphogenesis and NO signaling
LQSYSFVIPLELADPWSGRFLPIMAAPGGPVLQGEKEEREAWKIAPLADLVRHIMVKCHRECRVDMANLETMVELIVLEEGLARPGLVEVRDMITRFCVGMRAHLALEERSLFPAILSLPLAPSGDPARNSVDSLRELLEGDHESEAGLLRSIRGLASSLAAEAIPGGPETRIHEALKVLSERLQKHLYLENQVLFPRIR